MFFERSGRNRDRTDFPSSLRPCILPLELMPPHRNQQTGAAVRLLGVDPGTHFAGWGVVEFTGPRLSMIDCGVIRGGAKVPLPQRLRRIFEGLEEVLRMHRPAAAALEETFSGKNPKSAIAMGQGRGVALLSLARAGVSVWELSPAEIKKAVTGNGRATKQQVARMVCARLNLDGVPSPEDITDALAAAIALANRMPG